jgi:predicted porin
MKRIALVAALGAAFAAPAFAQSSVTVYGRLNTSVEWQDNISQADDVWVLQNNSSRIGFKGVEDLGGGLKADFFLEHRFNSDNGAVTQDVFWAGDSWVGLAGNFGWVRLGRITSDAYYATADYVSMHNHDTGTSADALYDYGYFNNGGTNVYNANKIAYTSPDFGGLKGSIQYALKETGAQGSRDDAYDVAVNYDVGNLHLGAGGTKWGDDWQVALRGLYTLGALTFGGYYQYSDLDETLPGDGDRHNVRGAVMYAIGATELHANVGWASDRGDIDDSSAIQYTLGANYNLSKRTKVYAFYTAVDNDDNAQYLAINPGEKAQSFMVGIRHNF